MSASRPLVVTGMHRSGTTFIGEILRRFDGTAVIHEPLNQQFGLAGVERVYPCDRDPRQLRHAMGLLHRVAQGHGACVRRVSGEGLGKALFRAISGGRTGMDLRNYRWRRLMGRAPVPVIKDPFAVLLSRSLLAEGFGVLAVVRHPMAVWQSIKRMGWRVDLASMGEAGAFPEELCRHGSEAEKFAGLWAYINGYVMDIPEQEGFLRVTHEGLCLEPEAFLRQVSGQFGLHQNADVLEYTLANMMAEQVAVEGRQLHQFQRNSQELAASWVGRVDAGEESVIRAIVGPLVDRLYGGWYPMQGHGTSTAHG